MNQFNLTNFFNNFKNPSPTFSKMESSDSNNETKTQAVKSQTLSSESPSSKSIPKSADSKSMKVFFQVKGAELKMQGLNSLQRSSHIKDLMNLPKELDEILRMLQNKTNPARAELKLISQNVDISDLVKLMQQGSKDATNKMVMAMSEASKQGITDLSHMKETMKAISSSVSGSVQDNPSQSLKNFMLLYLPWLPLQEGVDFELEVESYEGTEGKSESSVVVLVSTINFGNVKFTIVLSGMNSISIIVDCCEGFPKSELLSRIKAESKTHSIQPQVMFEECIKKGTFAERKSSAQAKISMSNLTEVNPFLLLMANALIRETIGLDSQEGKA